MAVTFDVKCALVEENEGHCRGASGMAQERNDRETAEGAVLRSLKNELVLAIRLLRQVKEAKETLEIETHVIYSARSAYRHATEALDRVPQLAHSDMLAVQWLMDEFRSALADLDN